MVAQNAEFTDRISSKQTERTLALLRELGGSKITQETGIAYHDTSKQILLPIGMSLKKASKLINAQAIAMEEMHNFNKVFRYRPLDGAYNFQETLKELFGVGGIGRPIHSMFGSTPPEYKSVEIAIGVEVEVPWGRIEFPPLEGEIYTGIENDPVYGQLFQVNFIAPKKYGPEIQGIFVALEKRLRDQSIYKGKAIVGVGRVTRDGVEQPEFLDAYATDPEKVAYKSEVFERLESSLWGPIRTANLQREAGLKLNRKTLLYGPYGTGKSLAGGLTAQVAVENGFTFIQTKTGDEELKKVLKTAELYAPAVVFFEDIDTLIESDPGEMAKMLEMFDGISSKNKEVMVLMTSNHVETLSKGMMRVGRIDAAIEIGDLDAEGIKRLLQGNIGMDSLADDLDFEALFESMSGYEPAFIMGTFNLAKTNAIIRTKSLDFKLGTADFVRAAELLRSQHSTHLKATDRPTVDTFGKEMVKLIKEASGESLQEHRVEVRGGGEILHVETV